MGFGGICMFGGLIVTLAMKKDQLSKSYDQLFKKYENSSFGNTLKDRGYVFQYDDDETECDLLFIGINPSYDEKDVSTQTHYGRNTARAYFKPFGDIHDQLRESLTIDQYTNWTHLDLFVHRETNQNKIKELMSEPIGCNFIIENLEITKKRLIHIKPKVIVVSNALAREFSGKNRGFNKNGEAYGVWMGLEFDEMDEEFGTFKVTNEPELVNTHFLFSSMLSGQRALDTGSRERLVWQVKRILRTFK